MAFDPFTAGFDLVKTGLDKFFPDANEELRGKLNLAASEIANNFALQMGQLEINKTEAASSSLFVSGWRPAVGWVCVAALGYVAIFDPLARFVATVLFNYVGIFPIINTEITMQILFALLGLGAYRTYEKTQGTVSK
jgi:hypothetical protein